MSPLARLIDLVHEGLSSMECKVVKGRYPYDGDPSCECWTCTHVRAVLEALSALADEHAKSLSNNSSLALVKAILDDQLIVK